MFASRFFRPAFRTATRSFATASRTRAALTLRQSAPSPFTYSYRNANASWQTAFRRAQTRQYARQAFNYRRFQQSSNLLRRWAARPTFYYEAGGIGILCGCYYIYNLEVVPVSGRRRFNVVSHETERTYLGEQMYQQTLQEFGKKILPPESKEHQMVQRVLDRLIPHSGLSDEEWEIHVIDDDQKNAFVIPGGKVFVFRGILDVCQGDDGLATVLGHEIAHNVCHHAAERVSQTVILLPVGILAVVLGGLDPTIVRYITNLAFTLPGSRGQEEEADYVGLLMMAESCYDPSAAIGLWARMEKEEQYAPPQFLSTHPSSHNRMEKIRSWLPEAEVKRESSDCAATSHYAGDFKYAMDYRRW